jgi:hypothetical protein
MESTYINERVNKKEIDLNDLNDFWNKKLIINSQ